MFSLSRVITESLTWYYHAYIMT